MSFKFNIADIHILPKLTGDNWYDWSEHVENFLTLVDLTLPAEPSEKSSIKAEDERKIFSIIALTIADDCKRVIRDVKKCGSAAWAALKKKYCRDTPSSRLALRSEFYSARFDPTTEDVNAFIHRILSISDKLGSIGHRPNDTEIADKILMSLDSTFSSIRAVLLHQTPAPSLDQLTDSLREFECQEKLRIKLSTRSQSLEEAHVARGFGFKKHGGAKPNHTDFDWGNVQDRDGVCWRCGRSGHISRNCITDMPSDVKDRVLKRHPETAAIARHRPTLKLGSESAFVFNHPPSRPPSICSNRSSRSFNICLPRFAGSRSSSRCSHMSLHAGSDNSQNHSDQDPSEYSCDPA